jgi:hypothetical protein
MAARGRGLESRWWPIDECARARTHYRKITTTTLVNGYAYACVAVAPAGAPHRAGVALQVGGDGRGPLPRGDRQHRAGVADLVPRQGLAPGDLLKDGAVMGADHERTRFPTTHGATSSAGTAQG